LHECLVKGRERISKTSREFELSSISLLRLAYLSHDLASTKDRPNDTVGGLCTLPYRIDGPQSAKPRARRSLLDFCSRPPVQLAFDSLNEEDAFVDWLSGTRDTPKTAKQRLEAVLTFYRTMNESLKKRNGPKGLVDADIKRAVKKAIGSV